MGKRNSIYWRSKVGQKFNKVTVIQDLGVGAKHETMYLIRCECGNERVVRSGQLRRIVSCGMGCTPTGTPKYPAAKGRIHYIAADYKRGAKKRNLVFALSIEQVQQLVDAPCFGCGTIPANGIDRIDSMQGYTPENVAPCCGICNVMKWDLTLEEFLAHVEKIQQYHNPTS